MSDYASFLKTKLTLTIPTGIEDIPPLHEALFPHQRNVTEYMLKIGRGAAFLDTGLGKTLCQLEWARVVSNYTAKPVLILAPLAVSAQTKREAERFGIPAAVVRTQADVKSGIYITNYEKLQHFDADAFGGVVLDESSLLKAFAGITKRRLCEAFARTPFRLCCTATPAPNDFMEIGTHAEFLGIMSQMEMLSRWFVNDTDEASHTWRIKGHAVNDFWNWVCSWARCVSKPSDLGFDDSAFHLPPFTVKRENVRSPIANQEGMLPGIRVAEPSATGMHAEKRITSEVRAKKAADIISREPDETWMVWCNTDDEADRLNDAILSHPVLRKCYGDSLKSHVVEVRGSQSPDVKEQGLLAFTNGTAKILISKAKIAGFGLNFQHCARVVFVGISYSYEEFYQAVRRCWRFGQTREVISHVIVADTEAAILAAIQRKEKAHDQMKLRMSQATRRAQMQSAQRMVPYKADKKAPLPAWLITEDRHAA